MHQKRKIVIVGFGNLGQAVIPLLHASFPDWPIVVIEQHDDRERLHLAKALGVIFVHCRVTQNNFREALQPWIASGDVLINLAHEVSSAALISLAQQADALYLDTGIEPWEYEFCTGSDTSNYALREQVLELKRQSAGRSTALVAHGANPGFVSVLVKVALLEMAKLCDPRHADAINPVSRTDWAELAAALDVRVIQISECDTQRASTDFTLDELTNTWSVEGFLAECRQEAELGWGTHEKHIPQRASIPRSGCRSAIQLATRGSETIVKSWSPMRGEFTALLLTHNESISIADYLTLRDGSGPLYRPTVFYAYRPIDRALESLKVHQQRQDLTPDGTRVLKSELADGEDELGVLLMSGTGTSLWLGSALSIHRARAVAPYNNATSLQVVSSIIGGIRWMLDHPNEGVVESDEVYHVALFNSVAHYWEPIQRRYTTWRPNPRSGELQFEDFVLPQTYLEPLTSTVRDEPVHYGS